MAAPSEQQPQDGITGLIERVTFHSEETGFAVLRVKAKGHRDLSGFFPCSWAAPPFTTRLR